MQRLIIQLILSILLATYGYQIEDSRLESDALISLIKYAKIDDPRDLDSVKARIEELKILRKP